MNKDDKARKKKYHYIYKVTRITDGMYYVGRHSSNKPNDGYFGSGSRISKSLRYHGKEAHQKEILEYLPDYDSLKAREAEIVDLNMLTDVKCLNYQQGGEGGSIPDLEMRSNLSQKTIESWKNPIYRETITVAIRERNKDPEYRKKLGASISKGSQALSKEERSLSRKKMWANETTKETLLDHLSDLHKKNSELWKDIEYRKKYSEHHSNAYKERWTDAIFVNDGIKAKKIERADLEKYLDAGFQRGIPPRKKLPTQGTKS
jgi:hypothetical protein